MSNELKLSSQAYLFIRQALAFSIHPEITLNQQQTHPASATCIYLEIGGSKIEMGLCILSPTKPYISITKIFTLVHHNPDLNIELSAGQILTQINENVSPYLAKQKSIAALLISFAGVVSKNTILNYSNLAKLDKTDFINSLKSCYPTYPLYIHNDCVAALLGTMYYKPTFDHIVTITIGTGFNITFSKKSRKHIDIMNTEVGRILLPNQRLVESYLADSYLHTYSKHVHKAYLYQLSAAHMYEILSLLLTEERIPTKNMLITLQGGIAEHRKVYIKLLKRHFPHLLSVHSLTKSNMNAVGLGFYYWQLQNHAIVKG